MTTVGNDVWFGTLSNGLCITEGGLSFGSGSPTPYQTSSWVCEFGKSPYVPTLLPGSLGDFRPPRIYVYNKVSHTLTDMTPTAPVSPANPFGLDPSIAVTLGIRAAGTIGNLVLLGGLSLTGGLNLFAFRADTHQYLGNGHLAAYSDIRQFVVANGNLYTAVRVSEVTPTLGGAVLKWTGSVGPPPCASCFTFEVVGTLDGGGAYIAQHKGRLYVTTWPTGYALASLFMSPQIPSGGLTKGSAAGWTKVWKASDYEPDPAIAASYAGGALASFGGQLYWGTMHVPWLSTIVFLGVHGLPSGLLADLEAVIGTFRTAVLFRSKNPELLPGDADLLYGYATLPAYVSGNWNWATPNNMPAGKKNPLFGPAGFGNPYNNYIWSMAVWNNRLWVGTMDWGYPAVTAGALLGLKFSPNQIASLDSNSFGADLYSFSDQNSPATAESVTGLGNYTSYGVRNMVVNGNLFLGMAGCSNLLTGPTGPKGGWELIELEPRAMVSLAISSLAGVSANSSVAPESIATALGAGLVTSTAGLDGMSLPSTLGGASLSVKDSQGTERPALLLFVSPKQINFLVPQGSGLGTATVNVNVGGQVVATGAVRISTVAPSLFSASSSGQGVAAGQYLRVSADGTQTVGPLFDPHTLAAVPIDLGPETDQIFLMLYGTGMRGMQLGASATVGGQKVSVIGPVPQGQFFGLDQVNVGPLPRSLAGSGEVGIVLTVDGVTANTVTVKLQ